MPSEIILKVSKLKKYYPGIKAIDGIDLEIARGEVFGFLGPNGAGKTTTIRCLMDFIRPDSGEIELFGVKNSSEDFAATRAKIGYLISGSNLNESWTGRDHISYLEGLKGQSRIVKDLIKRFSFDPRPRVRNLSSGNRQKLGLILALMHEPELLILDEPTNGLDPILQEEFYSLLRQLSKNGSTIFMSSHNLPEVEKVCSRVGMIKSGRLITVQKISELEGKKIHSVRVEFKSPVPRSELESVKISIEEETPNGYVISVKGEIDEFIKKIAKFEVSNLSINQANLEEIFMEFYK